MGEEQRVTVLCPFQLCESTQSSKASQRGKPQTYSRHNIVLESEEEAHLEEEKNESHFCDVFYLCFSSRHSVLLDTLVRETSMTSKHVHKCEWIGKAKAL